ncbi:hypothetical protein SAY87_007408 [Trapa incisa]|uniref:Clp R domain-containing protein n=1 Tax=Trapa incisa TaxID=236973 RepID=A0AAN7K1T5_9MYRT|nr:hypothetical protein SAY87_007408 [Trapa incisa]
MRAGPNWTAQQTLTPEAALVFRHSLGLARRRRHAQLTPLHVAVALLSSRPPSLLKKACLTCKFQSSPSPASLLPHSMQSRALELCFNVALNKLPTAGSDDLLSPQPVPLSNALVAALKRAHANNRRGCIGSQQNNNVISIKVDLGQLTISILDDPGVSRVLREAGIPSIAVKGHIEQYCSASSTVPLASVPSEGHGLGPHRYSFHELGIPLSLMRTPHAMAITKISPKIGEHFEIDCHCCEECTLKYEREVHLLKHQPLWQWQQTVIQVEALAEVRKKWNKLCRCIHHERVGQKPSHLTKFYGTQISYPLWATHNPNPFCNAPINSGMGVIGKCTVEEPNLDLLKKSEGKDVNVTLSLGESHLVNNTSSGQGRADDTLNKAGLLRKLKENVPWQSEKIGPIVTALTGYIKSTGRDTWIMIEGDDTVGKMRLVFAIGESLLGSADSIIHLDMRERSYCIEDLMDEILQRRWKYGEKEKKLVVVMVENVHLAANHFVKFLEERFEKGKFTGLTNSGEEKGIVFIVTKGDDGHRGREVNERSVIQMVLKANETTEHKRKCEEMTWHNIKKHRIDDVKEDQLVENGYIRVGKDFSGQLNINNIDLNIKATDEDYQLQEDSSPKSGITHESQGPQTFLESIKNRFAFNRSEAGDKEVKELFISKLKESFYEVYGNENKVKFSIDEDVLEEIVEASGFGVDGLLGKWIGDIFKTSLNIVRISGRGGESIRLSLDDRQHRELGDGFLNSSLPMKIRITIEE